MAEMARRARWLAVLALCCAGLVSGVGVAQAPAVEGVRIAYVDMRQILDAAPQVAATRERLNLEFQARNQALAADEVALRRELARRDREGLAMAREELAELNRRIEALEAGIRRRKAELNEALAARRSELLIEMDRQIGEVLAAYAREQGYDLVLTQEVAFASPRVDITSQVLERLRRQNASGSAR